MASATRGTEEWPRRRRPAAMPRPPFPSGIGQHSVAAPRPPRAGRREKTRGTTHEQIGDRDRPDQSGQGQARAGCRGLVDDGASHPHHRDRPHRRDRRLRHALHRPRAFRAHVRRHRADLHGRAGPRNHAGGARARQHARIHFPGARPRRHGHHRPACAKRRRGPRGGARREASAAGRALQHRALSAASLPRAPGRADRHSDQRGDARHRAARIRRTRSNRPRPSPRSRVST